MIYFAACQYDRCRSQLLIRELALIPVDNPLKLYWWLIKTPIDYNELSIKDQKTAAYLQRFGHGLRWMNGFTSPEDLRYQLPDDADVVLCNGDQVRSLLSTIFPCVVVDVRVYSLTKTDSLYGPIHCPYQHSRTHCAVLNAYKLYSCILQ